MADLNGSWRSWALGVTVTLLLLIGGWVLSDIYTRFSILEASRYQDAQRLMMIETKLNNIMESQRNIETKLDRLVPSRGREEDTDWYEFWRWWQDNKRKKGK